MCVIKSRNKRADENNVILLKLAIKLNTLRLFISSKVVLFTFTFIKLCLSTKCKTFSCFKLQLMGNDLLLDVF